MTDRPAPKRAYATTFLTRERTSFAFALEEA